MSRLVLASALTRCAYPNRSCQFWHLLPIASQTPCKGTTESVSTPGTNSIKSRDQGNSNLKYSTITVYDDNKPPIGVVYYKSDIKKNQDTWFFREPTGQVDVNLQYYQGIFAKNIGGTVGFPKVNGYRELIKPRLLNALGWSAD